MNRKASMASSALAAFLLAATPTATRATATAPPLGTASSFAVLGGSTVTNTGPSLIRGDLGLSPGSSITGFPPGIVVPPGTVHVRDAVALRAQADATVAYNNLAGQACDFGPFGPTDLAGQNLAPGVYCFSSTVANTGAVTLNGTATDVWVFKVASSLTTGPGSSIAQGNASKCNLYWQIGSSATLDTTSTFAGTIIALQSITINNGAVLSGRALSRNGATTLINDVVDPSGCAGAAVSGGVGLFKTFSPANLPTGSVSTLTIVLPNASLTPAVLTAPFVDNLPAGLVIANPTNLATTCTGGAPTGVAGGSSVGLPVGTIIPAAIGSTPGFCTLTVAVTSPTDACFVNTIPAGALQTGAGNNAGPATATICFGSAAISIPLLSREAMIALLLLLGAIGGLALRARRA